MKYHEISWNITVDVVIDHGLAGNYRVCSLRRLPTSRMIPISPFLCGWSGHIAPTSEDSWAQYTSVVVALISHRGKNMVNSNRGHCQALQTSLRSSLGWGPLLTIVKCHEGAKLPLSLSQLRIRTHGHRIRTVERSEIPEESTHCIDAWPSPAPGLTLSWLSNVIQLYKLLNLTSGLWMFMDVCGSFGTKVTHWYLCLGGIHGDGLSVNSVSELRRRTDWTRWHCILGKCIEKPRKKKHQTSLGSIRIYNTVPQKTLKWSCHSHHSHHNTRQGWASKWLITREML